MHRSQAEDYRIDQKEIDKHFLKGIAASPGIVIGKAYVFQDIFLLVERRAIVRVHAEKEITRLNRAISRPTIAHITCDIGPRHWRNLGLPDTPNGSTSWEGEGPEASIWVPTCGQ